MDLENRITTHSRLSERLKRLSDDELETILQNAAPIGSGIGGPVSSLVLDNKKVFVKRLHLANLELQPNNTKSTKNYFNLPLFYQYGVGSAGFGAWRELAAQQLTTEWVLAGKSESFPILYHSRILPRFNQEPLSIGPHKTLDDYVAYWNDSQPIRSRMEASQSSKNDLVFFLEFLPSTLSQWISMQKEGGMNSFLSALHKIEQELIQTSKFMRANNMVHFDGHPGNILTDGNRFYFSDFGLAISSSFSLSEEESQFLNHHRNYDIAFSAFIITYESLHYFCGQDRQEISKLIQNYVVGKTVTALPEEANALLVRYAPAASIMDRFFGAILKDKTTPFPSKQLKEACIQANLLNADD